MEAIPWAKKIYSLQPITDMELSSHVTAPQIHWHCPLVLPGSDCDHHSSGASVHSYRSPIVVDVVMHQSQQMSYTDL
eukprot:1984394-Rhodomonas_salina.1